MKKAIFVIVIIVLLFIINSLGRSIYDLWQKQDLLSEAQKELENEKLKNQKLKASLSYVESKEFIEEKARNDLFLAKPSEQNVVIPKDLMIEKKKEVKKENIPNWQKWFKLFF